ncbi:MAG: tRNA pseudouridine synthase B [Alphaproteobacteria bacterium MarineAlpha5_Bin9]|nr:MAG: tRNA pseudouridine synthase B [Alphaproteobacteria bacterium MarineAlpha5_Bin9]|tara:strand:+ start:12267 stop:13166 length:900 start_codon:yes stop_codon:yes gene_type:complete
MTDNGWINLYKPPNITSFKAINKIKKKFNLKKIGHAGTLDPNAEGILPIAFGRTTKLISFINNSRKEYYFEITWGSQTVTDDKDGEVIARSKNIPNYNEIENKLKFFLGNIMQKPPKVSAVKINGKRAYKRVLKKEQFETNFKFVKVYQLKIIDFPSKFITKFFIECGKGFYIRSFARDLAETLNSKAHISFLKRSSVGKFKENNSILLDDLLKIGQMDFGINGINNSISMLDDIPAIKIDSNDLIKDISYGKKIKINSFEYETLINKNNKVLFAINKENIISIGNLNNGYFLPKKVFI